MKILTDLAKNTTAASFNIGMGLLHELVNRRPTVALSSILPLVAFPMIFFAGRQAMKSPVLRMKPVVYIAFGAGLASSALLSSLTLSNWHSNGQLINSNLCLSLIVENGANFKNHLPLVARYCQLLGYQIPQGIVQKS